MKIVQIGSFPLDLSCIQGGVESSVYGLSSELIKNNRVCVIDIPRQHLKADKVEIMEGIEVFRFWNKGKSNTSALQRLKAIISTIKKLAPDICHIHSTSLFSLSVYLLLKIYRIPVITTVHGLAHIEKRNIWKKQRNIKNLIKYLSQSVTEFFYIGISHDLIVDTDYVKSAIELYKLQHKIFHLPVFNVVPQGINPVFFNLTSEPKRNHLLSVGSINRRKGHLLLLKSMQKVKESVPDFKLTIAGVLSDEIYYGELIAAVTNYDLNENIQFKTNASFEEVLALYRSAEIFVLHSQEESQGIVFCEAMAARMPIVATNVGGIPWVVQNNINGLLSDFGDIDTFANNIIKLMNDESVRVKMSELNHIQSNQYNWKLVTEKIVGVYDLIIQNS